VKEAIVGAEDNMLCARIGRIRAPFGDSAAQPADPAVLFDRRHHPVAGEDVGQANGVEGLDARHADHAHREAMAPQDLRRGIRGRNYGAGGHQTDVMTAAERDCMSDGEARRVPMHYGLAVVADADVSWAIQPERARQRGVQLQTVARRQHRHIGQHAHDREVFKCMMSSAKLGAGQARTGPDHDHRSVPVAQIDANLVVASRRSQARLRVDHRPKARHGKTGRNADRILLSSPAVVEAPGEALLEAIEQLMIDILAQQDDALIRRGQPGELVGKCVSHDAISSSRGDACELIGVGKFGARIKRWR